MPSARRELLSVHLPAALWLVLLTAALAAPADRADLPEWVPRLFHFQALDKVVHGLLFVVAGWLVARSTRRLGPARWPLAAAFLLVSLYGAATELGQHLFTERTGEVADLVADVAGAGVGAFGLGRRRSGR